MARGGTYRRTADGGTKRVHPPTASTQAEAQRLRDEVEQEAGGGRSAARSGGGKRRGKRGGQTSTGEGNS